MMDIKTLLEDEIDILYTTLDRLKIYDIRLSHTKDGRIFAKDADSQWTVSYTHLTLPTIA